MSQINILWTVRPVSAPVVRRACPKCGGQADYKNTGNFRINANQRHLDIWLIYQCAKCKSTWNLTVHTRIKAGKLPPALFERFVHNDPQLALELGLDRQLLEKNRVQADFDQVAYRVEGPELPVGAGRCRVTLQAEAALGIRLDRLLAQKFSLSRSAVERLFREGGAACLTGDKGAKTKLGEQLALEVDAQAVARLRERAQAPE